MVYLSFDATSDCDCTLVVIGGVVGAGIAALGCEEGAVFVLGGTD